MEIFVGKILLMKQVDDFDIHHGHKECIVRKIIEMQFYHKLEKFKLI